MNGKVKTAIAAMLLLGTCLTAFSSVPNADAATNGAGSQNDPVVTLSYLEYRLDKLENGGSGSSAVKEKASDTKITVSDTRFQRVILQKGEKLTPGAGSCIVIYSGNANVLGDAGLINLTEGTLYPQDCSLSMYNEYLVPDSSSGIVAMGACTVFVK